MSAPGIAYLTVLVADDSDDIRQVLKRALVIDGYHVVEASNGVEAIEIARQRCPDLILMDLNMPTLDGLAATEKIRGLKGKCEYVPIIAMTAFDIYGMKEAALQAGCNAYMDKPLDLARLEKMLRDYQE